MPDKSAIQRIKELDQERATLFEQAKEEALQRANQAVEDLNANLLQIEWVKRGGFSRVDGDFKGFLVNLTVTRWRHVCAHANIDQDKAPER